MFRRVGFFTHSHSQKSALTYLAVTHYIEAKHPENEQLVCQGNKKKIETLKLSKIKAERSLCFGHP